MRHCKMRSIIFCLSLLCILACGNRNSYTIVGRCNSAADGTMLYLTAFDDILAVIDSTEVEDGRFVFEGVCDTLSVCYISSSQVIDGGFVVLEPGEISFCMGNGTACSGTPQNNAVARFQHERERLANLRTMASPELLGRMNLEKHMADSLRSVAVLAENVFGAYALKQIKDNLENPLGCFFFVQSVGVLPVEMLSPVAELVPQRYRGKLYDAKVRQIEQQVSMLSYTGNIESQAAATAVGKKYQNFELNSLDGGGVLMSDRVSSNKYTLLCFWAGWNDTSLNELESLKKVYAEYGGKGFDIVAVSLDKSVEQCRTAVGNHGLQWVQLCNPGGGSAELAAAYGISELPFFVLINNSGTIILRSALAKDVVTKLEGLL